MYHAMSIDSIFKLNTKYIEIIFFFFIVNYKPRYGNYKTTLDFFNFKIIELFIMIADPENNRLSCNMTDRNIPGGLISAPPFIRNKRINCRDVLFYFKINKSDTLHIVNIFLGERIMERFCS